MKKKEPNVRTRITTPRETKAICTPAVDRIFSITGAKMMPPIPGVATAMPVARPILSGYHF
ncbi:hypothetical protein SDC9_171187 [bioreactor metagenome]|uniref:Uncharacterized protein n=1 Tax=bioreactor metagenome TaxID=1076179 RepID=A0A645GIS5_9ZZZZ